MQDLIFGSDGTAQADSERMKSINDEIGLTAMLRQEHSGDNKHGGVATKAEVHHSEKV